MASIEQLTLRQKECLRGVANFKSYKEIARDLGISDSMVEKHLRTAREKLGVDSTSDAARLFLHLEGEANPQGGFINLHSMQINSKGVATLEGKASIFASPEPTSTEAIESDPPLNPLQTLSLIGRVALCSIIALSLLIACAQGLKLVLV